MSERISRKNLVRPRRSLILLFGAMYFVQGIAEPTEGLIAQPVRSLLNRGASSVAEIAAFGAILSLPWTFKPLYGLLTDFVPLFGTRRRSYLLLTTAVTVLGLGYLYFGRRAARQHRHAAGCSWCCPHWAWLSPTS